MGKQPHILIAVFLPDTVTSNSRIMSHMDHDQRAAVTVEFLVRA